MPPLPSSPTYSRCRRRREAGGADATHLAYPRFGLTRCRDRPAHPSRLGPGLVRRALNCDGSSDAYAVQLAAKEPPSNRRRFDRELRSAAPHFPPYSLPGDALMEDIELLIRVSLVRSQRGPPIRMGFLQVNTFRGKAGYSVTSLLQRVGLDTRDMTFATRPYRPSAHLVPPPLVPPAIHLPIVRQAHRCAAEM